MKDEHKTCSAAVEAACAEMAREAGFRDDYGNLVPPSVHTENFRKFLDTLPEFKTEVTQGTEFLSYSEFERLAWYVGHGTDPVQRMRCKRLLEADIALTLWQNEKGLAEKPAEPEDREREFKVSYDVKYVGRKTMVVKAESESKARAIAQNILNGKDKGEFDGVAQDFVAAEVFEAHEIGCPRGDTCEESNCPKCQEQE